ncbi:hypothetical protein CCR95_16000 [Thiocystis minor]|nr:hypothetical protein [Thiocystis minor]
MLRQAERVQGRDTSIFDGSREAGAAPGCNAHVDVGARLRTTGEQTERLVADHVARKRAPTAADDAKMRTAELQTN